MDEVDYKDFALQFTDDVNITASENGEEADIAMLRLVFEGLGESKVINDPQFFYWHCERFRGTEIEIYGYDIDPYDNSLTLFVSDFGEPCHLIYKADVESRSKKALNFAKWALSDYRKQFKDLLEGPNYDLFDEIQKLNKSATELTKIKIVYVSNGKNIMRQHDMSKSFNNIDIDYYVWDIQWINDYCNTDKAGPSVSIDFKEEPFKTMVNDGLPFLEVPQAEELFSCYQCVVPGVVLSHLYRTYGSPLLEGNVRSFLSTQTTVNKAIQGTIKDAPDRFYIYNNGIAAIASDVTTELVDNKPVITKINDIQIINGGQTTASLAYASEKKNLDLSSVFVPMKITVIHLADNSQGKLDELVQKISETSNSQNRITKEDFFTNSPIHMRLKKLSQSCSVPGLKHSTFWFYERTRGEYRQSTMFATQTKKSIFAATNPKEKKLSKQDFSKYYNLLAMKPNFVSKGPSVHVPEFQKFINQKYENHEEEYFNEIFFKKVCAIALIYKHLEEQITKKKQPWFKGSYRAQIIYYGISVFLFLLKDKYKMTLDLPKIWEKDNVPEPLSQELVKICEQTYYTLISDEDGEENISQWSKNPLCWTNVKTRMHKYEIDINSIASTLISINEMKNLENKVKEEQKFQDEVDAFSMVFKKPYTGHWLDLVRYCMAHANEFEDFSSKVKKSLETVALFDSHQSRLVPTKEDCTLAIYAWKQAEITGFSI